MAFAPPPKCSGKFEAMELFFEKLKGSGIFRKYYLVSRYLFFWENSYSPKLSIAPAVETLMFLVWGEIPTTST